MAGSRQKPLLYRGSVEICTAVGINHKEIVRYVNEKKLPAFKIDNKGGWLALPDDLVAWAERMRNENLRSENV